MPGAGVRESGWRDTGSCRPARRTDRSACGPDRPRAGWSIPAYAPGIRRTRSATRSSKLRSSRAGGRIGISLPPRASRARARRLAGQRQAVRDGDEELARIGPAIDVDAVQQRSAAPTASSAATIDRASGPRGQRVRLVQHSARVPAPNSRAHQLLARARCAGSPRSSAAPRRRRRASRASRPRRARAAAASRPRSAAARTSRR